MVVALANGLSGCVSEVRAPLRLLRAVETAARPILEMHPDANWTACYNRLVELGPDSIEYLARQPAMQETAAPDDLRVMLHTSLLRLLACRATAPPLTANCFETTLNLVHFDVKVDGQRIGETRLTTPRVPRAWHDLYPTGFDHTLAAEIDVDADRRAMLAWWREHRGEQAARLARGPLRPHAAHLWPVLSRRYADVWIYELEPRAILCALPPARSALLREPTHDYNLVRAACIWLGTDETAEVETQLIELVAHPAPIVAHNARFALRYSPDPRIRDVLERYNVAVRPAGRLRGCGLVVTPTPAFVAAK
jgi:hypothetical protein